MYGSTLSAGESQPKFSNGELDNMTSPETVAEFVRTHHAGLTVMPGGEHWFHTLEQVAFLKEWLRQALR